MQEGVSNDMVTEGGREGGHGDAVAYVLGALEPEARVRFEAHAATCPECLREIEQLRPVADRLGLGVDQVDPPPYLRQRLMMRATMLAQAASVTLATPIGPVAPAPVSPGGGATIAAFEPDGRRGTVAASRADQGKPWWHWAERLAAPVAVASLAVALLSGGIAMAEHQELRRTSEAAAMLAETLSLMYQPGRVSRELSGEYGQSPMAKGMVYLVPDGNDVVLMAYNLPTLARQEVYQFWLNDPDHERRISGGTFKVDDRGRGHLVVRSPMRINEFKTCGVTKEPVRGSAKPTGPRMLSGSLNP
jgi:anti-sigma-K factor RskA